MAANAEKMESNKMLIDDDDDVSALNTKKQKLRSNNNSNYTKNNTQQQQSNSHNSINNSTSSNSIVYEQQEYSATKRKRKRLISIMRKDTNNEEDANALLQHDDDDVDDDNSISQCSSDASTTNANITCIQSPMNAYGDATDDSVDDDVDDCIKRSSYVHTQSENTATTTIQLPPERINEIVDTKSTDIATIDRNTTQNDEELNPKFEHQKLLGGCNAIKDNLKAFGVSERNNANTATNQQQQKQQQYCRDSDDADIVNELVNHTNNTCETQFSKDSNTKNSQPNDQTQELTLAGRFQDTTAVKLYNFNGLGSPSNVDQNSSTLRSQQQQQLQYIAPEQALVTNVELVVPPPLSVSTQLPISNGTTSSAFGVCTTSATPPTTTNKVNSSTFAAGILNTSSTSLAAMKTDGCVRDSETPKAFIPNTSNSTTTTTTTSNNNKVDLATGTCDILTSHSGGNSAGVEIDVNMNNNNPVHTAAAPSSSSVASIWAPHSEYSEQHQRQHVQTTLVERDSRTLNSNLDNNHDNTSNIMLEQKQMQTLLSKSYTPLDDNENYQMHHQQQQHQQDLMLESAKREDAYSQMLHGLPQYSQHQSHLHQQYVQMLHQQQQQQQNLQQQNALAHHQHHHSHYANFPSHHLQPQQHYTHEQMFGLQGQEPSQAHHHPHPHPAQLQGQMHHMQHAMDLEQQRQQRTQQHQMQDVYHDLMIDEFHEDPNAAFKLGLSPNNVKPENQDDGYETSAGDVLTPNSHSSSTHSMTPQHQLQHGPLGLVTQSNTDDPQQSQSQQHGQILNSKSANNAVPTHQRTLPLASESIKCGMPTDVAGGSTYGFRDDELRMMSPGAQQLNNAANSTAGGSGCTRITEDNLGQNQNSDLYSIKHEHQQMLHDSISDKSHQLAVSASEHGMNSLVPQQQQMQSEQNVCTSDMNDKPAPKRRGRKKKYVGADGLPLQGVNASGSQDELNRMSSIGASLTKPKERKKHDRFNGMSEDEVIKRTIPDHLCANLDIVIVGINPGLFAAYKGHHYAGPGNHFWKCLYLSGLTQEQMNAEEDFKLLKQGIGFTNMVSRATKGSADLTRKEIKEGSRILLEKLQLYRPKIAVFNGKLIFEVFSGKKDFNFGRQPDCVEGTNTYIWVMPSSSARCAQLPRAADKVPFYAALKKFRDYLNGIIPHIDESECVFTEQRIKQCCEQVSTTGEQTDNFVYSDSMKLPANAQECVTNSGMSACSNQNDKLMTPFTGNSENTSSGVYSVYSSTTDNNRLIGQSQGPGPPMNDGGSYAVSSFGQTSVTTQEKKKRGRPKKIRGQEIIDPATGNRVLINNQQQMQTAQQDFNNILNLSMMDGNGNDETPKKKRGRPKKPKPSLDGTAMVSTKRSPSVQSHQSHQQQTAIHQSLRMEHSSSPQHHQQLPQSLYNTPPPSHLLYTTSASPMASPALNCTYSRSTPPVSTHVTPPILEQQLIADCNKSGAQMMNSPTEQNISQNTAQISDIREPHLGETPPPSSPNMCSVDFEPPAQPATNIDRDNQEREQQQHQMIVQQQHQEQQRLERSRYSSPANESTTAENQTHEQHYPQWLSPPQHQQFTHKTNQQQQPTSPGLHFAHSQQQYQQQSQPSPQHGQTQQWQRQQQRFDNVSTQYLVSPNHHHHSSSPHHHQQQQQQQSVVQLQSQLTSDVARKSLSGLESLVDQIPTINESESNALPAATAAAAAAAVESRLLGLQQQQQQLCTDNNHPATVGSSELFNAVSNNSSNTVLNSTFSVSNLAASAATTSSNSLTHLTSNEYGQSSPAAAATASAYHHPNIISAALAAAAVNSPTAHHVAHPQMYSMYGSAAAAPPPSAVAQYSQHQSHLHHPNYTAYGQATAAAPQQTEYNAAYSLHNPYGHYGTATAQTGPVWSGQSNYAGYTHHPHPAHHLSVFERLKPSDIGSYSGF